MPSPFEQQFAVQAGALYEGSFGVAGSYQAPDGSAPVTVGADGNPLLIRVHRNDAHQVDTAVRKSGEMQSGEIIVRQSQLPKVVNESRFTIEGVEVWTVQTTPVLRNGEFVCTVARTGTAQLMTRRSAE